MSNSDWKVPVDQNGNQVTWGGSHVPPWEFEAELYYIDYSRGRSSVTFHFEDLKSGKTYEATLGEFHPMIPYLKECIIKGKFGFRKKGTSVSLCLIEATP